MTELQKVVDLADRTFYGRAWHGPSFKQALESIDAAKAAARPIPEAHSIWELVLHVSAWSDTITRRLQGEAVSEPVEGDFPPPPAPTDEAWQHDLQVLEERHKEFIRALSSLEESRLDAPVTEGSKYSVYITTHGAAHHYIYHAGQIALLKKALG